MSTLRALLSYVISYLVVMAELALSISTPVGYYNEPSSAPLHPRILPPSVNSTATVPIKVPFRPKPPSVVTLDAGPDYEVVFQERKRTAGYRSIEAWEVTYCLVHMLSSAYVGLERSSRGGRLPARGPIVTLEDESCQSHGIQIKIGSREAIPMRTANLVAIVTKLTEYVLAYDVGDTVIEFITKATPPRKVALGFMGVYY